MFWWPWPLRFRPHWDEPRPQGRWEQGGEGGHCPPLPIFGIIRSKIFFLSWPSIYPPREAQSHQRMDSAPAFFFCPLIFITFRRPCTIDFYDDNNSSAAKDDSNTAGGAQSLQRMDSAPAFFLLFKLLGKVFRTMTITKGLWGRATLTMDQKFEIGTPLMRNFLFFSFPSFFFFFLFSTVILS